MGVFDDLVFDEGSFDVEAGFGYPMDTIVEMSNTEDCNYAAVLSSTELALVYYDLSISADRITYQMAVTIVLDENSLALNESVINTILWSYGVELENVNVALQTVALRKDLSNVSGADLDEHWGSLFPLPRRTGESDGSYRRRLMTRTAVLNTSGTEPACTAVIESIINRADAVELITYWPAEVLVKWSSVEVMKLAEAQWEAIEDALNGMIPMGVTWYNFFPYKEYLMQTFLEGYGSIDYDIDAIIEFAGRRANHLMNISLLLTNIETCQYDVLNEGLNFKNYMMGMTRPWATRSVEEEYDVLCEWSRSVSHQLYLITHKIYSAPYDCDVIDEKTILLEQSFDGLVEKNFKRRYSVDVTLA